jgi:hypothetical protein
VPLTVTDRLDDVEKTFVGKKPRTLCRLSKAGRDAWIAYITHMQALLGAPARD